MDSSSFQVYLLNTGRVGGTDDDERGKKVSIPYSSAIVKAISEGTIEWAPDPDFGYEVAPVASRASTTRRSSSPASCTSARDGMDEYRALVDRLKAERRDYLATFPGLR